MNPEMYKFVAKDISEVNINRISAENPEANFLLINGGDIRFLLLISKTFLLKFIETDDLYVGTFALSPNWGKGWAKAVQKSDSIVVFTLTPDKTDDIQSIELLPNHRAATVHIHDIDTVRRQLKNAKRFRRELTIKVHILD